METLNGAYDTASGLGRCMVDRDATITVARDVVAESVSLGRCHRCAAAVAHVESCPLLSRGSCFVVGIQ